jgi:serine/threonine protein kinase/tetratricopeptide (TPR) repeat protein
MIDMTAAEDIFFAALDKPAGPERAAYLDAACGTNADLRAQVERLLAVHPQAGNFLNKPAPALAATGEEVPIAERPGTVIGPYKLLQQIGEGGMGTVFMAEQTQPVQRKVALKIIKPGMDSAQVIARFEAERQALAMMDHQNIARVLDAGTTSSGRPYFVMELVHGVPITQFCDERKLTPRQRLELFVPVCQALQHAHQKGIIHRDVKPSNVLVTMYDDKPVPKVIDFGVAKAIEQRLTEKTLFTQFGALVGTFEYMSPEQAELNAFGVDTRSDIYSLGVLLYELLTGTTPLERPRLRKAALDEVVRLIKQEEAPRPSLRLSSSHNLAKIAAARGIEPTQLSRLVRGEIDWIVMKCLEKDRARRYETANGLARDIERHLADEPVEACPPSTGYLLRKFIRRHKGQVLAAGLLLLVLLAGIGGTTWGLFREGRANAQLAKKNDALAIEQAKAEARFDLARKAIAQLHSGVSEDLLLKSDQFKDLRAQLLKEAASFYGELEKMLEGDTDAKARRLLADGYFQLATLTAQLGSQRDALELHRKALAARRELAAADGADAQTRLDVARSLHAIGLLVVRTDPEGALRIFTEQQEIARSLVAEPSVEAVLGQSFANSAFALWQLGRSVDALAAGEKGLAIQRKLAQASPDSAAVQSELAKSILMQENLLWESGKWAETLAVLEDSRTILEKLILAHPGVTRYRYLLAVAHNNIGCTLFDEGKTAEALVAHEKGRDVSRQLAETYPGVADFPRILAVNLTNLGRALADLGKLADSRAVQQQALPIFQRLAEAEHGDLYTQHYLAFCYNNLGHLLAQTGQPAEALTCYEKARAVLGQLAEAYPGFHRLPSELAHSLENTALLLSTSGKSDEALAACRRALAIRQKVRDAQPALAWLRSELAGSFLVIAAVQHRAGQSAEAVASLRRALKLLEGLPIVTPRNHYTLACCHAQLAGIAVDKDSEMRSEQGTAEAELGMKELRRAIADGYSSVGSLRADLRLEPLRSRADFKQLLAEVEKKQADQPANP